MVTVATDTNYGQWAAEDVVNGIIAPSTTVPSRLTITDVNWISTVWTDWTPYSTQAQSYDYIFAFNQTGHPDSKFVGIQVNSVIRDGGNAYLNNNTKASANDFFKYLQYAVDTYASAPSLLTSTYDSYNSTSSYSSYSYSLGTQGGITAGSDPNSMAEAAQAVQAFADWLDGTSTNAGAAPTLAKWATWLGSPQASWQGTAADAVYKIINELSSVLAAWQSKLAGINGQTMPDALLYAAYELATWGNYLYTEYQAWVKANTYPDGFGDTRTFYTPENCIRWALEDAGLLNGLMGSLPTWALSFPADRSGFFQYNNPDDSLFGQYKWSANQVWTYLTLAATPAPAPGLQNDAQTRWLTTMAQLDRAYQQALVKLVSTYGSSSSVLGQSLATGPLPPITETPPNPANPNTGNANQDLQKLLDGLGKNLNGANLKNQSGPGLGNPNTLNTKLPPGTVPNPLKTTPVPGLLTTPSPPPLGGAVPSIPSLPGVPGVNLASVGPLGSTSASPSLSTGLGWGGSALNGLSTPGLSGPGGATGLGALGQGLAGNAGSALAAETAAAAGESGIPIYPGGGGFGGMGAGGENGHERERHTWISEDEEVWGTDPDLPPSVVGQP